MKRKAYNWKIIILLIVSLGSTNIIAQEKSNDCRVLLPNISEKYEGECKNGFADGKGIAQGIDKYEGKFQLGLPNGTGTYTWKNGNIYSGSWKKGKRDGKGTFYSASNGEELHGYWKDDEFIEEITMDSYEINYTSHNVKSVSLRNDDGAYNDVELRIYSSGKLIRNFNEFLFDGNTGSLRKSSNYVGMENIIFPFEGYVRFIIPNMFNGANYEYVVKFTIQEPGSWDVIVKI